MAHHVQIPPNGVMGKPWVGSGSGAQIASAYGLRDLRAETGKGKSPSRGAESIAKLDTRSKPVLKGNVLLSALASRLVEGTLIFIDGIRGFRGFGGLRTVPVL